MIDSLLLLNRLSLLFQVPNVVKRDKDFATAHEATVQVDFFGDFTGDEAWTAVEEEAEADVVETSEEALVPGSHD